MSMRKIYREIARKHGVSATEVKREMQVAIDYAYRQPQNSTSVILQSKIPHRGETPTNEEFVQCMAEKVRRRTEKQG